MLECSDPNRTSAPYAVPGLPRRHLGDGATIDLRRNAARNSSSVDDSPPLPQLEIGRVLRDRYVIEQCLGTGGMGVVFKALDRYRSSLPPPHCYVAVKVLCESPESSEEITGAALQQELHCAQTLSHPNIAKVFDFDRDENLDFFTMELLEGELLSDIIRRCHPVPMSRAHAWSIIGQIASGLQHAHERHIVHADLKPQNIMITDSGEVRILDFGAAHILKPEHARTANRSSHSVTPAYACCELLEGRVPDRRDDLYALSCIAYELLSGTHPFQRRRANEARDLGVVPTRPAALSRRQWRTLAKGLSWHRAGRAMSVGDWLKALKPAQQLVQRLPSGRDLKPEPPAARAVPRLKAPAIFGLLVIVASIWVAFTRVAPGGNANQTRPAATRTQTSVQKLLAGDAASPPAIAQLPAIGVKADTGGQRKSLKRHGITLFPIDLGVSPGQHFAEIRLHRNTSGHANAPFVWWTEAASAKPGIDYVPQSKVTQAFPAGKDLATLYVKLLPRNARKQSGVFYVAVEDKESAGNAAQVTQAELQLPSY